MWLTPSSIANAVWMENGGMPYQIFIGGGEYGKNGTIQEPKCKSKCI
jgi:hypothetical protein